jgi:hypothetical protein
MPLPHPASNESVRAALRSCLWWCLPALIIGAALRISVMIALPEGYYGTDSNSYFGTTTSLWREGRLELKSKRRWIYPLLLLPTPALPGRTVTLIAIVQHTLGLATVFGIGWITMHLTQRPGLWVPLVTTLTALWPRMLWYEHEVIAESLLLATVVPAVVLAYPAESLRRPGRLFWFLFATTVIVAVKPHGRPIWLGLMGAAVLIAGLPWHWDMVLSDDNAGDRLVPEEFWHEQEANNRSRWEEQPQEMELLYELDHEGYNALVAERQQRHAWYEPYLLKFTRAFAWMRTVKGPPKTLHPTWFGLLALLGFLSCFRPAFWRTTSPLWLSLGLYLGIIFSVGDTVSRYLVPVDWMGMVLVALGLDWSLQLLRPVRSSSSTADSPAAA